MNKLSIILLSFAFSSVSFAATNSCETLLNSVNDHLTVFEEAMESNDKLEYVTGQVAEGKPVSCSDLKSVIKTVEVMVDASSSAAKDMGTAEAQSCKTNPDTDMKAEDIFVIYFQFEYILKELENAQSSGNCIK